MGLRDCLLCESVMFQLFCLFLVEFQKKQEKLQSFIS